MAGDPSAALLADTRRFWHGRTRQAVSAEDAREAIANVAAFFRLLAKWDADASQGPGDPAPAMGEKAISMEARSDVGECG